jgi:hypothetical protein
MPHSFPLLDEKSVLEPVWSDAGEDFTLAKPKRSMSSIMMIGGLICSQLNNNN